MRDDVNFKKSWFFVIYSIQLILYLNLLSVYYDDDYVMKMKSKLKLYNYYSFITGVYTGGKGE